MSRRRPKRAPAAATPADHQRVLLDLQVHQEELQQQNEELRTAHLALEAARDRYSALYDTAPVPYLTLSRSGLVREANETCLGFLGLPLAGLADRPLLGLVAPAFRSSLRHALKHQHRRSKASVMQVRMRAARGEIPVELHMRPTVDDLIYTAIVDLSERERMESERRALLVEAEVARAASAAKDRFLAGLSHELRTPLTPVIAVISGLEPEIARGSLSMNQMRDFMGLLHRNLDYEVRLIDDLLDASRLAFGKMTLESQDLDLHEIVREAVVEAGPEAERKELRLSTQLRARKRHVHGDAFRLRQVFWNLLRNAIKFTPENGRIEVTSRNAGDLIAVEVRDTGVGISPDDLPHVFERFAQASTAASGGGLGLGLTIVQGIVEAHGGRVSAESAGLGLGASFTVELATTTATAARIPPAAAPATEAPAPVAGRRILLVDDHEETAAILAQLLRAQGYDVTVAHTMREALAAGRRGTDLVITDIGLPDGNGIELVERLRPRLRAPAIALTGYGRQEDVDRSRAAGFVRHLVKPVEFPRLLRTIREIGG